MKEWQLDGSDRMPQMQVAGEGPLPQRAHHDDAGYDLVVHFSDGDEFKMRGGDRAIKIEPGETKLIPHGISLEFPPLHWGLLCGRSSTLHKRKLQMMTAVIDPGYRGPMFSVALNIGDRPTWVHEGDRLAQIIPIMLAGPWDVVRVAALSPSTRGEAGFGSTGT